MKSEGGVAAVAEVADAGSLAHLTHLTQHVQGRRSVAKLPLGESKGLRRVAELAEAEKLRHTFTDLIDIHWDSVIGIFGLYQSIRTSNLGSKMVFHVSVPAMLDSCRRRWRLGLHSRSETCTVTETSLQCGKASCSTRQSPQHEQPWAMP